MRAKRATNAGEGKMFAKQTETNFSSYRPNVLTTSNKLDCHATARNDETTLVPSKRAAFTKPSRGTSDSERRTIINGNRVFRFDCERCRLTRGAAFTLAEVLITLGIIGVVAAMTIPNVVNNNTEKKKIVKLKKVYSQLSSVYDLAVSEKQLVSIKEYLAKYPGQYDTESHIAFRDFFMPYFNVTKKGEYGKSYMAKWIQNPQKTSTTTVRDCNSFSTFVANDGTAYIFRLLPFNCTSTWGSYADKSSLKTCGEIFVDLYPTSKSLRVNWNDTAERVVGKDVFMFHVTADGIVPGGMSSASSDTLECYTNGYACTHWVLMNENMDYLHCDGLSGNGKRKCE